ncbi:hypothetical protein [Neotabrizicola shimadae]|uniref:Uncharacterized protein n=1 Tax=Neotabrizicola shimadae TaxID=2807096 RepID=A0A8G1EC39_9RHOB|nr:hypothetical protein [Neotabrizicola shimadae]QYZ70047.1 hypothetical protein JO391_00430 [Neotabrizicola shimadae]
MAEASSRKRYEKLRLSPGILTIRSAAEPGLGFNAIIRPIVPLASRHAITLVFDPSNAGGALTRPDEICVIRCSDTAEILLELLIPEGSTALHGGVEIDYLVKSGPRPTLSPSADLTAYIDRSGDRSVRFGSWIGGEVADQAILGLMLHHRAHPPRIVLQNPVTGQIAAPGEFLAGGAGGRPFSQLRIWIEDPDGQFRLSASAEFELAGRTEVTGTFLTLTGANPADRLLRLKLQLTEVKATVDATVRPQPASGRHSRIRIFRKSTEKRGRVDCP